MEFYRIYAKKTLNILVIVHILVIAVVHAGLYFWGEAGLKDIPAMVQWASANYLKWVVPVSIAVFVLWSVCLWMVLQGSAKTVFKSVDDQLKQSPLAAKGKKDALEQRIEQERRRRVFLHTLSVLQREGRLIDFFDEDLSLYEDDQIGAAVRSIQEDCKKAITKYIDPKPVMDAEEGDAVTIEPGFDMDQIKLVGHVAGEPPFQGVLKHRGWRAGKKDVPRLADVSDSSIIFPAEVEIE